MHFFFISYEIFLAECIKHSILLNAFLFIFKDIPDAPQSTEVHDVTSRSVRLSWSKPFDGNSPITQYTVMWRQISGKFC